MKHAPTIAGALLGLAFFAFGLEHFHSFIPKPKEMPAFSSESLSFMGALGSTGYLDFVKVLEMLGGLLVALPKTRNIGLLVLGPVIVNILCFHAFLQKGSTLVDPMLIVICLLALFLLWSERKAWAGLLNR
jgi:putative oxidoreductase